MVAVSLDHAKRSSKLMIELNGKDVYRGVERATDNLKRRIIVRGPVYFGLVEEYVGIS
jgi:hypothetical protein